MIETILQGLSAKSFKAVLKLYLLSLALLSGLAAIVWLANGFEAVYPMLPIAVFLLVVAEYCLSFSAKGASGSSSRERLRKPRMLVFVFASLAFAAIAVNLIFSISNSALFQSFTVTQARPSLTDKVVKSPLQGDGLESHREITLVCDTNSVSQEDRTRLAATVVELVKSSNTVSIWFTGSNSPERFGGATAPSGGGTTPPEPGTSNEAIEARLRTIWESRPPGNSSLYGSLLNRVEALRDSPYAGATILVYSDLNERVQSDLRSALENGDVPTPYRLRGRINNAGLPIAFCVRPVNEDSVKLKEKETVWRALFTRPDQVTFDRTCQIF